MSKSHITFKKQLFSLILLLLFSIGYAQDKYNYTFNEAELIDVIKHIEIQHSLRFSYAIDQIQNKKITFSAQDIELEELLNILESQTGLRFDLISKNQIIITPVNTTDKVCGYILDIETKLPIPYATIIASNGNVKVSDAKGFFLIDKTEDNDYTIDILGYVSKTFSGKNSCQQIFLTSNNELLEEIIISGYVTSGIDRNKDGSITTNSDALGILPGLVSPDLLQSIQLIPGINTLDESASGIQIRGGTPDQNLILLDDIKLFNTGYLYGMFSSINPYATKKANIFKSGTSAAYGDRISGIIDITTGEDIPKETESSIGLDGLSIDGFVKTALSEKVALYLFGRRSIDDVYRSPTYESFADKVFSNTGTVRDSNGQIINIDSDDEFTESSSTDSFSFHDMNAKLIYTPNKNNKLIFSGLRTRNTLNFSFIGGGQRKSDDIVTINNGLSFKWKHQGPGFNNHDISIYMSQYDSDYVNEESVDNILDERNTIMNSITDFGLNLKFNRLIGQDHILTFGYQISNSEVEIEVAQIEQIDVDENIVFENEDENLKNALFAEFSYNTANSSLFGIGLRAVHYSSLGEVYLEPRFNTEYKLNNSLRFKASAERRHQPISQVIEFDQGELRLENNIWQLSNKTDNPILRGDQISAGLLFHNKGWTIDFDAYYKELSGLTSQTNGFGNPQMEFDNGESLVRGLDVLIKKRIENYRVWIGYTYNWVRYAFPNIQKGDFSGNNDITHSFRISNSLKINQLELSLGWQYRTGEPYTPITSFDPETSLVTYGNVNSFRLMDFHRLDASAIYNFTINKAKNWKGQLGFSVLNIYNRRIPISYTYISEDEGAGLELQQVIQRFSLGITPNASFRVFIN